MLRTAISCRQHTYAVRLAITATAELLVIACAATCRPYLRSNWQWCVNSFILL